MRSAYEALQLGENVSVEIVNLVHRRLARENHPDKGGTEERIKEINWARDTLVDPEKRTKHDEELRAHRAESATSTHEVRYVPFPFYIPVSIDVYRAMMMARANMIAEAQARARQAWSPPKWQQGSTRVTPAEPPREEATRVYVHPAIEVAKE